MNIINKNEALKSSDGTKVSGYVLVQNYLEYPTKNGGTYIGGVLQANGDVQFKVWGNCQAFNVMATSDIQGCICAVNGYVNEYSGAKSFIIEDINLIQEDEANKLGLNKTMFFNHRYDLEAYWAKLNKILQSNLSEQAMYIFNLIMSQTYKDDITIKDKFLSEFAALHYHDNCIGGLLAHTTKLENLCKLIKMYPSIISRVGTDILYLGTALHDIGKVFEYTDGVISNIGMMVSHNVYGCLLLGELKQQIIDLKGETFYWTLISVISQHHGEYGDRPRTVAAYVINQIDCLDATLTLLNQTIEESESEQIKMDGWKLI